MNYAVYCTGHGLVELSDEQYESQMNDPSLWSCPICREPAEWSDEVYEAGLRAGSTATEGDKT